MARRLHSFAQEEIMKRIALSAFLSAVFCIVPLSAQVFVRIGPPAPVVERRIPPPSPRHVWVNGYYRWDGRAYVWSPGYWAVPPRPRAVWIAPRWERRHGGWVFIEGRWR
jgi:hypothetical protein